MKWAMADCGAAGAAQEGRGNGTNHKLTTHTQGCGYYSQMQAQRCWNQQLMQLHVLDRFGTRSQEPLACHWTLVC